MNKLIQLKKNKENSMKKIYQKINRKAEKSTIQLQNDIVTSYLKVTEGDS
jgi:hypothetical protein